MVVLSHSDQAGSKAGRRLISAFTLCLVLACAFVTSGFIIKPPEPAKKMQLTSSAFKEGEAIPAQYSCDGKNMSPPLAWEGAPTATKSFVLIMDDPDASPNVWVHWVVFDLPDSITDLSGDLAKSQYITGNARQGLNDFKHLGYGGPCPPPGKPHRYFFKLYALDTVLDLKPGATKKDVEFAMMKHILAQGQLMGTYQRK